LLQPKISVSGAVEKRGLPAVRLVGLPAGLSVIAFSFSVALASEEAKTKAFGEGGFVAP